MVTTLIQLRYFVAVADELSFTRAAERLHLSQPSLSAQVRSLEAALGRPLFTRTTRRVELTPAGRELHERLTRVLGEIDDALAAARAGAPGRLRLAHGAGLERVLPPVVGELARRGHAVDTRSRGDADAVSDVREGRADACLVFQVTGTPGLRVEALHPADAASPAGAERPGVGGVFDRPPSPTGHPAGAPVYLVTRPGRDGPWAAIGDACRALAARGGEGDGSAATHEGLSASSQAATPRRSRDSQPALRNARFP